MATLKILGVNTTTGQESDLTTADNFATGAINIGAGITPSITNGDIVAGDGDGTGGTSSLTWTTSTGIMRIQRDQDTTTRYVLANASSGTSANAAFVASNDVGGAMICASYSSTSGFAGAATVYGFSSNLQFYVNTDTSAIVFNVSGGGYPGAGWRINSEVNGRHFRPSGNNQFDIGATSTRVRNGYFQTSVNVTSGANVTTLQPAIVTTTDGTRTVTIQPASTLDQFTLNFATLNRTTGGDAIGALFTDTVNDDMTALQINNTNSGTNARSRITFLNDEGLIGQIMATSSTMNQFGIGARTFMMMAGGADESLKLVGGNSTGGITLSVASSFVVQNDRIYMEPDGHWRPVVNNSIDIGTSSFAWRNGYFGTRLFVNNLPVSAVLGQATSVDLTATGTTTLYSVPAATEAITTAVIIRLTTATSPNADATITVGTNAATYDNIITSTTLNGLNAVGEVLVIPTAGIIASADGDSSDVITFQVDSADTGSGVVASIEVIGYLL